MWGPTERESRRMAIGCAAMLLLVGAGAAVSLQALWPLMREAILWVLL